MPLHFVNPRRSESLAAEDGDSKNDDVLLSRLFMALALGNYDLAKTLIDSGVDVAAEPALLFQVIFSAGGHEVKASLIELLISRGADVDQEWGDLDCTRLRAAISSGCKETIHLLINRYEANIYDRRGKVECVRLDPLREACIEGKVTVVEALNQSFCNCGDQDCDEWFGFALLPTAWSQCDREVKAQVIKLLFPDETLLGGRWPYASAMHILCRGDHGPGLKVPEDEEHLNSEVECAELLLELGADVNNTHWDGVTPLHEACREDNPRPHLVRFLLENGADVNAVTEEAGNSSLHLLCRPADIDPFLNIVVDEEALLRVERRRLECVRLLLEHAADVDIVNEYGDVPFVLACEAGKEEIIEVLLAHHKARSGLDDDDDDF